MTTPTESDLPTRLARVLELLHRTEPKSRSGDTTWVGPYVILRRGEWWPTSFVLYRGELHCRLEVGWSSSTLLWSVGTHDITFDRGWSFGARHDLGPEVWPMALAQVERKLQRALAHPDDYNRRVERRLPLGCRSGRIRRRWTWPRGAPLPMRRGELRRVEKTLSAGSRARAWRKLDVARYLALAARAYDAAFPELTALDPREKYRRRADTRHGGMLDRVDAVLFIAQTRERQCDRSTVVTALHTLTRTSHDQTRRRGAR